MLPIRHVTHALLLGLVAYAGVLGAQPPSSFAAGQGPDDVVLNIPYSANRRFTSLEKSANGSTQRTETGGSEARDSQGRTYSAGERTWIYQDNGKPVLKREMLYRINDPVARTQTNWDSTSREAKVIHWPRGAETVPTNTLSAFLSPSPSDSTEELGTKTIARVMAEGTRTTYKASLQRDHHAEEVSVVHEKWYCPDLKVVVLETNDDPRSGTWRNELIDIVRGEPEVTRYRPPKDYVVTHVRVPAP